MSAVTLTALASAPMAHTQIRKLSVVPGPTPLVGAWTSAQSVGVFAPPGDGEPLGFGFDEVLPGDGVLVGVGPPGDGAWLGVGVGVGAAWLGVGVGLASLGVGVGLGWLGVGVGSASLGVGVGSASLGVGVGSASAPAFGATSEKAAASSAVGAPARVPGA
ncbi:MAG TPA: hypothetical protein VMF87_29315 [Streptosporangiaceae bacterium]|nr:hypothetical protein [Streptosporangiaceae bacterium]